jgi:hypothetical protein
MNDYPPARIEQGEQLTSTCCGNRNEPLQTSRRKWWSFMGAGSLIAVGYMDPGDWATALEGGARYGYDLLFVVLLASLIGMLPRVALQPHVDSSPNVCGKEVDKPALRTFSSRLSSTRIAEITASPRHRTQTNLCR